MKQAVIKYDVASIEEPKDDVLSRIVLAQRVAEINKSVANETPGEIQEHAATSEPDNPDESAETATSENSGRAETATPAKRTCGCKKKKKICCFMKKYGLPIIVVLLVIGRLVYTFKKKKI